MGDTRPTEIAEQLFAAVAQQAGRAGTTRKFEPHDLAYCMEKMAEGLGQLAVGVRATYILLDQIKAQLPKR